MARKGGRSVQQASDHRCKVRKFITLYQKVLIFIGIAVVIGGILFLFKPVRKIVGIGRVKLSSFFFNNDILDETPNIDEEQLSIKVIDGENVDQEYTYIEKQNEEIHKGELVLVNTNYRFWFLEEEGLVNLKKNKNKAYKLMDQDMLLNRKMVQAINKMMSDFEKNTGRHDMIITSAYRSLEAQNNELQEKVNEFGNEEALNWVMLPGYSEHHTGYAVDMSIMTDDDVYIQYKGQNEYAWINQNCFKYGIIRRYTDEKVGITGISNEPWHYRFVGVPHAYLMTIHDLCLEEYIAYIEQFTFDEEHLFIETEEGNYEIYYVPMSQEKKTSIPVPKDKVYSLSGNNIDGFVVTIYRGET